MTTAMTTAEILAQFPKLSALVVGDICLDRWCAYDPSASEPSRETGIPRLAVVRTEATPGAGGTVANNLAWHVRKPPPTRPVRAVSSTQSPA